LVTHTGEIAGASLLMEAVLLFREWILDLILR